RFADESTTYLMLFYPRVTASTFPSSAYRIRSAADAAGTTRAEATLRSGLAPYAETAQGSTLVGWGNYAWAGADPSNAGRLWMLGIYATTPAGGADRWATAWGAVSAEATPAAPTGFTAAAASSTQITLSWTDASANESGFTVERKTGATGAWSQVADLPA